MQHLQPARLRQVEVGETHDFGAAVRRGCASKRNEGCCACAGAQAEEAERQGAPVRGLRIAWTCSSVCLLWNGLGNGESSGSAAPQQESGSPASRSRGCAVASATAAAGRLGPLQRHGLRPDRRPRNHAARPGAASDTTKAARTAASGRRALANIWGLLAGRAPPWRASLSPPRSAGGNPDIAMRDASGRGA